MSFDVKSREQKLINRISINKFIMIVRFLEHINSVSKDKIKVQEGIKRLMSDNGFETVNEIICHIGLSKFFRGYHVATLFGSYPDGFIIGGTDNIPVEIKSKSPLLIKNLISFYKKVSEQWDCLYNKDLKINLRIERIEKNINKEILDKELTILGRFKDRFRRNIIDEKSGKEAQGFHRFGEHVEYKLEVFSRKSDDKEFYISSHDVKNSSYCTKRVVPTGSGFSGYTLFNILLQKEAVETLTKVLIEDGIKFIKKKLPPEPRIIVIHSSFFGDKNLKNSIDEKLQKYVESKKGTLIMTICDNNDGDSNASIEITSVKVGEDFKEKAQEYFFEPTAL